MPITKRTQVGVAVLGGIVAIALGVIGLYDRIADTSGLSLEILDPEVSLGYDETSASRYYVVLYGDVLIINNNSRSLLIRSACLQKYMPPFGGTNATAGCMSVSLSDQNGTAVQYPIQVPAYDKLVLRFEDRFNIEDELITIAYDALVRSRGLQLDELQTLLQDLGFNVLGQRLWEGDAIWLPCGSEIPKRPQYTGIVLTVETAEKVRRSCGTFFLDASFASFMAGPWLGKYSISQRIPLDAFERTGGPRNRLKYEEKF